MELYKIKPKFLNLIDKLELARQIYERAANRIHNDFMADPFRTIASKKKIYIKEVAKLFDFDYDQHELELMDRIRVEWEKIGIELNHLILQGNEKALLEYCIHREQEILKIYKDILEYGSYNDLFNTVIRNQMHESIRILDELQHMMEPYDYDHFKK
jgi:hypothetical protein